MRLLSMTLMLLSAAAVLAAGAPRVTLALNGKPTATVVLATAPTLSAQYAALELQQHVRRITGAVLPIVTDEEPIGGIRILVGESALTRKLKLPGTALADEEYLIHFRPDTLVLMGRDFTRDPSLVPPPVAVPGRFGRAGSFDGRTLVDVPQPKLNDEAGTMEAWVSFPVRVPEKHGTILRLDGGRAGSYHILQRDAGTSLVSYMTHVQGQSFVLRSEPLAEGWHHLVATWDAAAGKQALYVDGKSAGTAGYVQTDCGASVLGIGGLNNGQTNPIPNPFIGLIDEVRLSNVVRDPATDASGGPYTPDAHTTCLYHFDAAGGYPLDGANTYANAKLPRERGSNGTLFAVYDFLERSCGVRWYAPGEIGLVCPRQPTLSVTGQDRRHRPAMEMRMIAGGTLLMPTPRDPVPAADFGPWRLRMRLGGKWRTMGHSFYAFPERYRKEHPDWLAQGYGDKRVTQMCYTSQGFIGQVVKDANDYFDGQPAKTGSAAGDNMYGLVPMDNGSWCQCANCQALLNPDQKGNPQFNNGWASDYIFEFTNRVAREVGKRHPDQWLGQLAYSQYAYHPEKAKLEPNISVQLCLHTRNWWCPSMEANDRKMVADWRRLEPRRPLYLWIYYCFPALVAKYGNFNYFPGFFAHSVVEQMRLYDQAKIGGFYIENSSECGASYLMDQLEYYVTFKLADDPTQDGNQLIEEFFAKYYGAAAQPMKALYCRIEDLVSNPKTYPPEIQQSEAHQHQTEELAWKWLGTPERMAEMQKLMDAAVAVARTDVERERVRLFKVGIWDPMVEGRRLYDEHQRAQGKSPLSLTVPKVADAGGDPARVDWAKAPDQGGWGGLSGDPIGRKFETRLAHDGKYLYVRLIDPTNTAKLVVGDQVWNGDDFELVFAPARTGDHNQFVIAPDGKTLSLTWAAAGGTSDWASGGVAVSDRATPGCWTVAAALPLGKLWPGGWQAGQKVYANFYRHGGNGTELLSWQPIFASGFHTISRLPELALD